ncbi:MAG: hypothetical protein ACD_37C00644G0002 [uncultured bacterium]|nr:MAG: hypothetical protein ACD_37C00644G0002 [uncultured bacterium]
MARSLNRVQLIGNLTRDPELRYTPQGTAVCSFGLATNRNWTTDTGEKKEEAEFHRIVAWNKLAELCSQFLTKGKKVYLEGRLSTRTWNAQDGSQKSTTEIIISDMILVDGGNRSIAGQGKAEVEEEKEDKEKPASKKAKKQESEEDSEERQEKEQGDTKSSEPVRRTQDEEVAPDDIPF